MRTEERHDLFVLFPAALCAALSSTILRHHDEREVTVDLFGVLVRTPARTVYVPQLLIGTGIDRVRRWGNCSTDPAFRLDLCEQLSQSVQAQPTCEWMQLGNVHRHPGDHDTPSGHTDVPGACAYLRELPELPLYLTGIVHVSRGVPRLRMHAIDRDGGMWRIPWAVADLPTVTEAFGVPPAWITAPLALRNRARWLATRGCAVASAFAPASRTLVASRDGTTAYYEYRPEGGPDGSTHDGSTIH